MKRTQRAAGLGFATRTLHSGHPASPGRRWTLDFQLLSGNDCGGLCPGLPLDGPVKPRAQGGADVQRLPVYPQPPLRRPNGEDGRPDSLAAAARPRGPRSKPAEQQSGGGPRSGRHKYIGASKAVPAMLCHAGRKKTRDSASPAGQSPRLRGSTHRPLRATESLQNIIGLHSDPALAHSDLGQDKETSVH